MSQRDTQHDEWVIAQTHKLCTKLGWRTDRVVAVNIQKNRTEKGSTVVVDFTHERILDVYPDMTAGDKGKYKETNLGSYLICYRDDLDVMEITSPAIETTEATTPFCCTAIAPYRARRLDKERYFTDFVAAKGNYDNVAYEVKKQVNSGALICVNFFQLRNNEIVKVEGPFHRKMDAFKNYVYARHNLFFGVDLYSITETGGSRYHHQRLSLFTHIHRQFLESFFADVL